MNDLDINILRKIIQTSNNLEKDIQNIIEECLELFKSKKKIL